MILLWGIPGDDPIDDVAAALSARDADVWFLDQRDIRAARVEVAGSRGGIRGSVTACDRTMDLAEVRAAYIRPQESSDEGRHADASLIAWADVAVAGIVNRPAVMASNNSKPYQLALIRRFGFEIPDTLVTTDPIAARRFLSHHGRAVYKSVSGVRSIVSVLREEQLERLADVANAPTQFQQYISGDDVRAHVIGERVIATRIRSHADDYRYPIDADTGIEITEMVLPDEVEDRCRAVAHGLGLLVAGIDLRYTPDGCWFCFEANPSPAFTFYERATGQPISAAIAELLIHLDHGGAGKVWSD